MNKNFVGMIAAVPLAFAVFVLLDSTEQGVAQDAAGGTVTRVSTPSAAAPAARVTAAVALPAQVTLPELPARLGAIAEPPLPEIPVLVDAPLPAFVGAEPGLQAVAEADPLFPNERVAAAEPVRLDMETLSNAGPGDRIQFRLPDQPEVTVVVTDSRVLPNGDVQWQGYMADSGDAYPAQFTLGSRVGFASITTPEGSYSLEAVDGSGWIARNPEMADLGSENTPDHLHPPVHLFGRTGNAGSQARSQESL